MNGKTLNCTREEKDLGVWITDDPKAAKQCAEATKKENQTLGMVKRSFRYRSPEIITQLYKSLIRPHLDYCIQAWRPHLQKDIKLLEGVQRRTTKTVSCIRHLTYEERLKKLHLTTLEVRHRRADLIQVYKIFNNKDKINPTDIFQLATHQSTCTRGHSL